MQKTRDEQILTYRHIHDQLIEKFPLRDLEVRIGSKSKTKPYATVLVYTTSQAIEDRLDRIVGPENWTAQYQLEQNGMVCSLTILGVTKDSTFEVKTDSDTGVTKAEASSFKRAASKHGIGRYLWSESRTVWAELDASGFTFLESKEVLIERVLHCTPQSNQPQQPNTKPILSEGRETVLRNKGFPPGAINQINLEWDWKRVKDLFDDLMQNGLSTPDALKKYGLNSTTGKKNEYPF